MNTMRVTASQSSPNANAALVFEYEQRVCEQAMEDGRWRKLLKIICFNPFIFCFCFSHSAKWTLIIRSVSRMRMAAIPWARYAITTMVLLRERLWAPSFVLAALLQYRIFLQPLSVRKKYCRITGAERAWNWHICKGGLPQRKHDLIRRKRYFVLI